MTIIAIIAFIDIMTLIFCIMTIIAIIAIIADCFLLGWLASVGSRVVYELDYKKPILYVVPMQNIIQSILG